MTTSPAEPGTNEGQTDPPPSRPGASTFTIEGRASPALFVVGWLASLLGLSIAVAGVLGGSLLLAFFVGPGLLSLGLIAACGNQAFERRARGMPYAGPSPFLVFGTIIAISYFVGFIVGTILDLVLGSDVTVAPPVAQLVVGLITAVVFIGVIRLTVVGTGALSWADMQIRRFDRRAFDDLALGAALAAPVVVVTVLVGAVLITAFGVAPESPLPPTGTTSGLLLQLIVGAVIAPVSEELVFRGFAVTAWAQTIGPDRAVIRASLLFALAHVVGIVAGSLEEAVGLIVVGFASRLPVAWALGTLFVRRRSIWAPIGLHATFNAILLILAHLAITSGAAP
ncbi:MAG TPA: CPBP family intramembrane glutamic endopeptidase [Candidatus Limnocylindrales bacterium]|nr:CPBP family intramembrane glutamic endopeptidase [Candidatus Limnocylindrales bacterium]